MKYLSLFFLFLFVGCIGKRNKGKYLSTVNLCKYQPKCACDLYLERYRVFGMGALGSDVESEYVTDSVNFNIYMGHFDEEDEMIVIKCDGDSIFVEKRTNKGYSDWLTYKVLEHHAYSLTDLRKERHFD